MRRTLYALLTLSLNSSLILAGYEVEFLIEDSPVKVEREITLKKFNFSSARPIDEEDMEGSISKIGDKIGPFETLKIKLFDMNDNYVDTGSLCEFMNQSKEERDSNQLWQSIVFNVKEGEYNEDVTLYWAPSKTSVFVSGGGKDFSLSAFQRNLPIRYKNGTLKSTVKINFFNKNIL